MTPVWLQRDYPMSLSERRDRAVEATWMKLAWAIPKRLAYWATIRVGVHATTGEHSDQVVPEMKFVDVLERWR
jgi:hypothetical protein